MVQCTVYYFFWLRIDATMSRTVKAWCKDEDYVLLDVKSFRSETIKLVVLVCLPKQIQAVFTFFVANFVC